jgi:outer membrane lipoprotein-sorting protein
MLARFALCALIVALGSGATPYQPAKAPEALVAFDHAWKHLTAYSTTVTVSERQGSQTQTMAFDYSFSKPSNIAVHVVSGANKGARLAWGGGDTVLVRRGSGLLSLLKKTVSLHDPLVTTIRGSTISQLSFGAILQHSRQPGVLSESRGDVINGVATERVTLIPSHPLADGHLTREVIEISSATHLPARILGYEGSTLVRTIDFADIRLGH